MRVICYGYLVRGSVRFIAGTGSDFLALRRTGCGGYFLPVAVIMPKRGDDLGIGTGIRFITVYA